MSTMAQMDLMFGKIMRLLIGTKEAAPLFQLVQKIAEN